MVVTISQVDGMVRPRVRDALLGGGEGWNSRHGDALLKQDRPRKQKTTYMSPQQLKTFKALPN